MQLDINQCVNQFAKQNSIGTDIFDIWNRIREIPCWVMVIVRFKNDAAYFSIPNLFAFRTSSWSSTCGLWVPLLFCVSIYGFKRKRMLSWKFSRTATESNILISLLSVIVIHVFGNLKTFVENPQMFSNYSNTRYCGKHVTKKYFKCQVKIFWFQYD